jgi:hypothetical protein
MSRWRDCIIVLMDLIGLRRRALEGDSAASALMRSFHKVIRQEMADGLHGLDHAYVWNDSVLLLAYVGDRRQAHESAIHAADTLKRKIDAIAPSYAIAVKGRAFPSTAGSDDARVTFIKASSYAMANCFEIEAEAKSKRRREAWYIDVRIARKVPRARSSQWIAVPLLPYGKRRRVYLHAGYLWDVL